MVSLDQLLDKISELTELINEEYDYLNEVEHCLLLLERQNLINNLINIPLEFLLDK